MPFTTDVVSLASSVVTTRYLLPFVVRKHYVATMLAADRLFSMLPSLPPVPVFAFPSLQRALFGTFFYAALCAGDIDMSVFKPLGGKVTWTFVQHSGMISSEPLLDEFWDRPVVAFWAVRNGRLAPIGGGWLVHQAILTAGHVLDAMRVLREQGATLYVGKCHRVVVNVNGLYPIDFDLIARPTVADMQRHPIAGDFALRAAMADGSLCTLVTPLNPKSALKNSPDSAMQTNSHVELAPCGTAEPRRDAAMCLPPRFFVRNYLSSIGPVLTCVYGCPIEECLGRAADWVKGFVPFVC